MSDTAKEKTTIKPRAVLTLLVIGLAGFCLTWGMQRALGGKPPTKVFDQQLPSAPVAPPLDPGLERMKAEAGGDPAKRQAYVKELVARVNADPSPPPPLVLETIDALRGVLIDNPKDAFALQAMADISFDQQVFGKAVEFYERYLEVNPGDDTTRARYASALAFSGRLEDAVSNLEQVLTRKPNDFHALAYLAIAKAQQGRRDEAMKLGERALAVAPNEEAKRRFTQFLESVSHAKEQEAEASSPAPGTGSGDGKTALIAKAVKQSAIASPHFSRTEIGAGDSVRVFFNNFPIAQMPDNVRETFMSKLSAQIKAALPEAKEIVLIDEASGETMLEKKLD